MVEVCLLFMILQEIYVLQVRMELDLVDGWRDRRCFKNPIELLWQVVADANSLCKALALELFHLLPLLLVLFFLLAEEGRMDKIPRVLRQPTSRS